MNLRTLEKTTLFGFLWAGSLGLLAAQVITPNTYQSLSFRYIGPPGNKVVAIAGIPGDPQVIYAGTPSGGVFKSVDGGLHWIPVFDGQPVASIGSISVARTDSKIVWVGTGETFVRENVSIGNGIYKSIDGGDTWHHMGLDATGRIGRIAIDPKDPNIVYAAAMGSGYGPQPERGLFRTRNGGKTWDRVLFVNENTGVIDVAVDPINPQTVLAATWQLTMGPSGNEAGGPGSGIYLSKDGGTTWTKLTQGLPDGPLGKIGLAIAPSNPKRVYALIASAGHGNLWKSDDGGVDWKLTSSSERLNTRAVYFSRMSVLPDNPDEAFFLAQSLYFTKDGGVTNELIPQLFPDQHDIWIDPTNANRILISNDRYVNISNNRGRSWFHIDLPNSQVYRVATDRRVPYNVYGNRHDGPGFRGPSNARTASTGVDLPLATGQIDGDLWEWVAGTEVGWSMPDPDDNNLVWTSSTSGVSVVDMRDMTERPATPWPRRGGNPAAQTSPDQNRTGGGFAFAISPHLPRRVYVGSQFLYETLDRGRTWTVISPDLTANVLKPPTGPWADGPVTSTLFSIAESPVERGVIWTGSTDGVVQVTTDGGVRWTNVTANISGIPALCTVSSIEPSRHSAGVAYVTIDCHRVNDRMPYVIKTADYGKTWTSISSGVPKSAVSYARIIREDPVRKGLLYLGTEQGLYFSFNDGETWLTVNSGLPRVPVSWITVQEDFDDLVLSTFGRGFWIMDDITPLQQLTPAVLQSDVYLFVPRAAYALAPRSPRTAHAIATEFDPPTNTGHNPPPGGSINYYLKAAPSEPVRITISGKDGKTIRTLDGPSQSGVNRVWWDLRGEPRPAPPGSNRANRREGPAPIVPPGTYTVSLSVGGQSQSARLIVLGDPAGVQ